MWHGGVNPVGIASAIPPQPGRSRPARSLLSATAAQGVQSDRRRLTLEREGKVGHCGKGRYGPFTPACSQFAVETAGDRARRQVPQRPGAVNRQLLPKCRALEHS